MDYFLILLLFFPAIAIVLTFGFGLFTKLALSRAKIQKDFSYEPTVTVLLPVFNEGVHVLDTINSILACNYPTHKLNIVAVDDCSKDDSYHYVLEVVKSHPSRIKAFKNSTNVGKHMSLAFALKHASSEIVICIDSDCIFHPQVIRELVSCFTEENVGAVGGRVGVSNVNENIITQGQSFIYYLSFNVLKVFENLYRNVICISGCMFAVRRVLLEDIEEEMRNRNWFGVGIRDGEDRFMTHLIVLRGYKTYINLDAQCWTSVPNNLKQLFMQQLRWKRSGLRDLFWTLRSIFVHAKIISPLRMIHLIAPALISCVWVILIPYGLLSAATMNERFLHMIIWMVVFALLGGIYNIWVGRNNPEQKINNPILVSLLCPWLVVNTFFLTILALLTFDVGEWGTRNASSTQLEKINAV